MCDRCTALGEQTLPLLVRLLENSGDETLEAIGASLGAVVNVQFTTEEQVGRGRLTVDSVMLTTYPALRRQMTVLLAWLILRMTALKGRVQGESMEQGDRHTVAVEWNGTSFTVRGTNAAGERTSWVEPVLAGEHMGHAAMRIMWEHLNLLGEIHQI